MVGVGHRAQARQRRGSARIFYDNYKVTIGQEITLNRDLSLLENSSQPSYIIVVCQISYAIFMNSHRW